MKVARLIISIWISQLCATSFGQNAFLSKHHVELRTGFHTASQYNLPFLQRVNQYGVVPYESHTLNTSVLLKKNYDSLYTVQKKLKRFGYAYELEPWVNVGRANTFHMVQAYAKVRYGAFEIYGGRRREMQGLTDTLATMGSYIWSGNALPLPKIEASIPNYTPIIGKGLISIKGNFAHGWFGKGDSVQQVLLHQKSLYGRLGKPHWKIKIFAGFNHQVQWGGYPTNPFFDKISQQWISKYTDDFDTYFKVVTGFSMPGSGVKWDEVDGVNANEAGNRFGNHLGTVDIALSIDIHPKMDLFIYRQSIYDDGSLFYLNNIADGLNGISLNFKNIPILRKINIEYLNTSNQGGNNFFDMANELRGNDNYFNNSNYFDGWTYKQMVIGSPFMISNRYQINGTYPNTGINYFTGNRVKAANFLIMYHYKGISANSRFIFANQMGAFSHPYTYQQISFSQNIGLNRFGIDWKMGINTDTGPNFNNNFGFNFQASKRLN